MDLGQVLQESVQAFAAPLSRGRVQVHLPELPGVRVLGQPALLVQIFNSLIANALESMGQGATCVSK